RPYYKKKKFVSAEPVIYLLCQKPAFFANLFPQSKATGADTNYKFIKATMFANLSRIKNLNETFFIILKSIFIPDIGNQNTARMIQFKVADKVGFINYNLTPSENYFDCDVFNEKGDFFKVYIKDISSTLDLSKVGTIISTASAL
ncbi:MAG: hypothetical protein NTW13_03405, partial [Candidatus Omnitrophica bacterium]|nr:hypothetical protein [Candidatus Omnitrophota bacterium]